MQPDTLTFGANSSQGTLSSTSAESPDANPALPISNWPGFDLQREIARGGMGVVRRGVDTRSDIYSLGVLLYELITGSTP